MAASTTTTEVGLVNEALQMLGEKTITALSDSNDRAEAANLFYANVRDEVTRAHNWNCAMVTETLDTPDGTDPEWGYSSRFALSDLTYTCLRVVRTDDLDISWRVQGGYLHTDESEINIRYLRQMSDDAGVADMDPLMRRAVAAKLAMTLALRLSASDERLRNVAAVYDQAVADASHADAIEMSPHSIGPSLFEEVRVGDKGFRPIIPYEDY